ncbi:MAG: hypothetical protein Q8P91_03380 [bacterium]|nr:hypothetical protein [bacterium]
MKFKLKNDKYKKARGGPSRFLDISCEGCQTHLFYYQKDGPGILKRMYIDRIFESDNLKLDSNLVCPKCNKVLAIITIYEKENRPALRLFAGAITKKIIKAG